jgi:glycosyltransferase involved in cell wall biosynthesis
MVTISIITVVYNNEAISTAIESVLAQDYSNLEYIIIDGASSDNTLNIINGFNGITKIISEPDSGIYDAINKGVSLATGDVVGILNSDDFMADSTVVSRIAANFNTDPLLEAVYADIVFVDPKDLGKITRHYSSAKFRPWMFKYGFQPAHPTLYVRREIFDKYGLYKINYKIAGDYELLLRLMLIHQIKYKYIKDVWVKMRTGGVSTSGIKSILKLNSEIISSCKANGVYTNSLFVYSKYLVKWWGFIFK